MATFYEFFAGGGMARAGLGEGWSCTFANDFSEMKGRVYGDNWGEDHLVVDDVANISTNQLPDVADLAWASFPCQDLSLAGNYVGIGHRATKAKSRSGTFWPFWSLIKRLSEEQRAPKIIALENVYGVLRANRGNDFKAISSAFSGAGYRFGAMVIDAKHFLPQSRPRVFVVGVQRQVQIDQEQLADHPNPVWHPKALCEAFELLSAEAKRKWVWWNLPIPPERTLTFSDVVSDRPKGVTWHTREQTGNLLSLMSAKNLEKVQIAKKSGERTVGGLYRRTRIEDGESVQRAEVRFDDVAGCLRTPTGGSSRQTILVVKGNSVRSRLLAPLEAAKLMGLDEQFKLPKRYNDAYHVAGDGVAVPVVRYLAKNLFEPILTAEQMSVAAE
ncbi:DNA cytosine methyltransferase [uncultured Ruegeria sp.]|uniref:DNA cytosine methyltransferase n=1 Tax=uncultured Ruegeria sp. TaxID=259304 RepID=UPI0026144CB5|nr:DNA cytosine methyltransferase [uncultured Ruegeria sp.]